MRPGRVTVPRRASADVGCGAGLDFVHDVVFVVVVVVADGIAAATAATRAVRGGPYFQNRVACCLAAGTVYFRFRFRIATGSR